jgi:hypothetical protein
MTVTPTGHGYWLADDDGGIFAYGDAPFLGAPLRPAQRQPVTGIASD